MSKTTKSKAEIQLILQGVQTVLQPHTGQYPAISGVILAISDASRDLTATPERVKVPAAKPKAAKKAKSKAKAKTKAEPKSVEISFPNNTVVCKNVPFGAAHYALLKINGEAKEGSFHNAPGKDWDGAQVYRSCRDKKSKSYILPLDKADEVVSYFESAGVEFKLVGQPTSEKTEDVPPARDTEPQGSSLSF